MTYPWDNPPLWHAMNVHLPVVLSLLGIPLVCAVAIARRGRPLLRWGTILFYAAIIASAFVATSSGERALQHLPSLLPAGAGEQIEWHEWMAEKVWIFAAATLVCLLVSAWPRRSVRQFAATLAVVGSVLTGIWVGVTGHMGGSAVYEYGLGTQPMLAQAESREQALASSAATQPAGSPAAADAAAPGAAASRPPVAAAPAVAPVSAISYSKQIKPLLSEKCSECHSGDSPRGKFEVTSVATLSRAGRKAGPGIIPGKPAESSIVQYVLGQRSPRMPKGDPPLSEAEIKLLSDWIAAGAVDDSSHPPAVAAATDAPAPSTQISPTEPASPAAQAGPTAQTSPVEQEVATEQTAKPAPDAERAPAAKAATAPSVSSAWEPDLDWSPAEQVAVRRYLRLQFLPPAPAAPRLDASVSSNPIDAFIVAQWSGISGPTAQQAPRLCDDAAFVRRVYLDVIGVIPSDEEARKFCEDKSPDKRTKLIDALLARSDEYAANWVPFWEDALCSNGQHQGGVGTHGNYRKWIFDNFKANTPFDLMVSELLDPTMPNNPGRYVLNQDHTRTVQSASDTAQVFMGTAIKCASCHNNFENPEWPQKRAAAFAGFFGPKDLELIRCERKTGQFVPTRFMFDLPGAPNEAAPEDQAQRLRRVAQLIVDPTNPRFAKTIVNRLWKRYLGLGLFEPADDYREDRTPNHAALLEWLAQDFVRSGCNIKHTIRLILTSRTYQLAYDPALEDHFDVARPNEPRYFRSPTLRRLTAEQLLDSIAAGAAQPYPLEQRTYNNDNSTALTRALGKPPTRNEVSTARPEDTAVVQALELLNGPEYHDRIYKAPLVAALSVEPELSAVVTKAYWSILNRTPSNAETDAAVDFLKAAPPPATTQPVEITWVDDELPPGAKPTPPWKWSPAAEQPALSGTRSHTIAGDVTSETKQHLFTGADLTITAGDTLFAYVFIDPASPPKQIMLQWHLAGGDWDHRAAWGESIIPFQPQTAMGPLPKAGEWVRLEVPASKVGLAAGGIIHLDGISFDQAGGRVYWDKIGVTRGPALHNPDALGDMIWALMTSPEFQYIR